MPKPAIFDSHAARSFSIDSLKELFSQLGVRRIVFKKLAPNDNSKNQIYLAGHLTELAVLPVGSIVESPSGSGKTSDPKRKIKFTANMDLCWVSADANLFPASSTKLIYYPQYPEVRMSGFLQGSGVDPGGWMDPYKKGRSPGRVLLLGITKSKRVYAWLAIPESRIASEIDDQPFVELDGALNQLTEFATQSGDAKVLLIRELSRIHQKGWITGKRLNASGETIAYNSRNAGGYTLEAELGIKPNGIADPDFLGWEIKQFKVNRCHLVNSKALTIMTPEPDGGFYVNRGVEAFVRKYGYANSSQPGRYDFTGRHEAGSVCIRSGLKLEMEGYDRDSDQITNAAGKISLVDNEDTIAASWSFEKLLGIWKRKHAKAAYIPTLSESREGISRYSFCPNIRLFRGASLDVLLGSISRGKVYYDPGINLKTADSGRITCKRRSQFRIRSSDLGSLYREGEAVDVTS